MSLKEFFGALGPTSEKIAYNLQQIDARGVCKDPRLCSMAVALAKARITWPWAHVHENAVRFHDIQILDFHGMPEPTSEFIRDFDAGKYPFLVCTKEDAERQINAANQMRDVLDRVRSTQLRMTR